MIGGMPIPRRIYRQIAADEQFDIPIQDRNDFIAIRYGETSARQKIILDIDNYQCVFSAQLDRVHEVTATGYRADINNQTRNNGSANEISVCISSQRKPITL